MKNHNIDEEYWEFKTVLYKTIKYGKSYKTGNWYVLISKKRAATRCYLVTDKEAEILEKLFCGPR